MFSARAAAGAEIRKDASPSPSLELFGPHDPGCQDQVEVGGVYVTIGQHLSLRQRGERGDETRLARSALATEDD
jgi:hypothetical protein